MLISYLGTVATTIQILIHFIVELRERSTADRREHVRISISNVVFLELRK